MNAANTQTKARDRHGARTTKKQAKQVARNVLSFVLTASMILQTSPVSYAAAYARTRSDEDVEVTQQGMPTETDASTEGQAEEEQVSDLQVVAAPEEGADPAPEQTVEEAATEEHVTEDREEADSAKPEDSSSEEAEASANEEELAASEVEAADASAATRTLRQTLKTADGKTFKLALTYDGDAGIPEGAELRVAELTRQLSKEELAKSENRNRPLTTERFTSKADLARRKEAVGQALEVADDDYLFYTKYLDVAVVADGKRVQPKDEVTLTVKTNAISRNRSDAIEAVLLTSEGLARVANADADLKKDFAEGRDYRELSVENATKKGQPTKLGITTDALGEIVLAGVAQPLLSWDFDGTLVDVLGSRYMTATDAGAWAEQPAEGLELLRGIRAQVNPDQDYGTALWLSVRPGAGEGEAAGEHARAGALVAYRLHEGTYGERLVGPKGTSRPVAITDEDEIALLWQEPAEAAATEDEDTAGSEAAAGDEVAEQPKADEAAVEEVSTKDESSSAGEPTEAQAEAELVPESALPEDIPAAIEELAATTPAPAGSAALVTVPRTLKAKDAEGTYEVVATYGPESGLPADARLRVRELEDGERLSYRMRAADAMREAGQGARLRAFDITFLDAKGNEVEPSGPVDVRIRLIEAAASEGQQVLHFSDDATAKPESVEAKATATDGGVSMGFTTESFSVYGVVYTVDFHWGEYTFNLAGGSEIFLSELLDILGVQGLTIGDVTDVSFSDDALVKVELVEILGTDTSHEYEGETDENLKESRPDWRLTSLAPFDTDELLTITLRSGETVEIRVTDERKTGTPAGNNRATVDGVTYTFTTGAGLGDVTQTSNEGDGAAYYGRATVYAITNGCTVHNEIVYNNRLYKVWNIAQYLDSGRLTGTGMKMDRKFVNRAAGYSFGLPEMKTDLTQAEKDELVAQGFVAGANNDASDNKIWKKATYDPDTNSITYEIKTFQAMKEDVPLDFIFIYDDSVTMYTGDRGAPVNNANNNYNETVIRETQGTRLLILSAAQALLSKTRDEGYDIRMAMGGASSGDNRRSDWFSLASGAGYGGVEEYLAKYATGVTNHSTGVNNALTLARQSVNAKRHPIVVYLSDFIDGGGYLTFQAAANQLHNIADVYCLSTRENPTERRLTTIASSTTGNYIHTMSEISDGVRALKDIIYDAIGFYMKDKVTITDNLSDALSDLTPGAAELDDFTYNDKGTEKTAKAGSAASSAGKNTWTIGGTSPYPGAGTIYTETFSTKLDDGIVYAGAMPTNGLTTVTRNGEEANSITPNENDPDHLHAVKSVTLLLGKLNDKDTTAGQMDSNGAPLQEHLLSGIGFTLSKDGATLFTGTTENGSLTIPYKDANGRVILEAGQTYKLQEDASTVEGYNSSSSDKKLKAPDKWWNVVVSSGGIVTVEPAPAAGQTPEPTIAKAVAKQGDTPGTPARIVLWNQIVVPATLIPITVRKTWPDNANPHDPVPFAVYGVEKESTKPNTNPNPGMRHKLKAYTTADGTTEVKFIAEGSVGFSKSEDGLTWTQVVYVPDKMTEDGHELEFYSEEHVSRQELLDIVNNNHSLKVGLTDNTAYTPDQILARFGSTVDGQVMLVCNKQFSYNIEEGNLVYENGWYEPEYSNTEVVDTYIGDWSAGVAGGYKWVDYDGEVSDNTYQFYFNPGYLEYRSSSSDTYNFYKWFDLAYNYSVINGYYRSYIISDTRTKKFFTNLASITIGIRDTKTGEDYTLTIQPGSYTNSTYGGDFNYESYGGVLFKGIKLPKAFDTYGSANTMQKRVNNLTISSISVKAKGHTNTSFVLYGKDPETGATRPYNSYGTTNFTYSPDSTDKDFLTEFEASNGVHYSTRYPNRGRAQTTVPTNGTSNVLRYNKYTPPVTSKEEGRFVLNSNTLDIENRWVDNPLVPIKVTKEWVNADGGTVPSEEIAANDNRIVLDIQGQAEGHASKPADAHTTNEWSSAVDNTISGNPGESHWERMLYLPQYDTSTYVRGDTSTPLEYEYSAAEEDLSVALDPDGYPKGEWSSSREDKHLEDWNEYPYERTAYLKVTRTASKRTYSNSDTINLYYISDKGTVYRSELRGFSNLNAMSGGNDQKDKVYYIKLTIPQSEEPSGLWLLEHGLTANGSFDDHAEYKADTHTFVKLNYDEAADSVSITRWNNTDPSTNKYYGLQINNQYPGFEQVGSWSTWNNPDNTNIALKDVQFVTEEPSEEDGTLIVPQNTVLRKYVTSAFTFTNTFTPNKAVTLKSQFTDTSEDRASTKLIASVVYTISGTTSKGEPYTRTVTNASLADESTNSQTKCTFNKTVYIPKGTYTIAQTAYTLTGEANRYEPIAFKVTGGLDNASINADTTVTFTNVRKTLPVQVKIDWEPGLLDSEDPLADNNKELPYTIQYENVSATNSAGSDDEEPTKWNKLSGDNYKLTEARQIKSYTENQIPSYSLRGLQTECERSDEDMAGALPDYDLAVVPEERKIAGVDTLVFIIQAHIKRAPVIIEKSFDEEFSFDDYKGATLTYTIKRSDGENIYGTDTDSVTLTIQVPNDQAQLGDLTGRFVLNDDGVTNYYDGLDSRTKEAYEPSDTIYLPVLRAIDAKDGVRVKYVVSEAVVKNNQQLTYFPTFIDLSGNAGNAFEQTNQSGKNEIRTDTVAHQREDEKYGVPNWAKFILNPNGIIIGVGNSDRPYICKIVETYGAGENQIQMEVPFRRLRAAVRYARENLEMDGSHPVKIQMLVDYTIPGYAADKTGDTLTLGQNSVSLPDGSKTVTDNFILTTAATEGGLFNFIPTFTEAEGRSSEDDAAVALIARGFTGDSMFKVTHKDAKLAFEKITLDGHKTMVGTIPAYSTTNGGLVSVTAGIVNANANTTMRNAQATNGGAVYLRANATAPCSFNMSGNAAIEGCRATYGGAVYVGNGSSFTMSNGTIKECKEGIVRGGAVYLHADVASKASSFIMNDGSIKDCKAADGGAVCMNAAAASDTCTFTMNNGTIKDCSATIGGAVHLNAVAETDSCAFAMNGGTIESCGATTSGGAVYIHNHSSVNMEGGTIKDCHVRNASGTEVGNGGAVMLQDLGPHFTMSGGVIESCTAAEGGAVGTICGSNADSISIRVAMSGGTIKKCEAKTNTGSGGALSVHNYVRFTMSGGVIQECAAASRGSAVWLYEHAKMSMSGGEIKSNTVSSGCGAVEVANSGSGGQLTFSRNAKVYDNTYKVGTKDQQKNVVLQHDSNNVINIAAAGMGASAKIGVYVTGEPATTGAATQFDKHGVAGAPFGTFLAEGGSTNKANPDTFLNDRRPLKGTDNKAVATDNLIYWKDSPAYLVLANRSSAVPLWFKIMITDSDGGAYDENIFTRSSSSQTPIAATKPASGTPYYLFKVGDGNKPLGEIETLYLPYAAGMAYRVEVYEDEAMTKRVSKLSDKNIKAEETVSAAYDDTSEAFTGTLTSNGPDYKVRINALTASPAQYGTVARVMTGYQSEDPVNGYNVATYAMDESGDFALSGGQRQLLNTGEKSIVIAVKDAGFDFSFRKIDGARDGNGKVQGLNGATFALYTDPDCADAHAFKLMDTAQEATSATVTRGEGEDAVQVVGVASFEKIPVGTYYMKETAVPTKDPSGADATYQENEGIYQVVVEAPEPPSAGQPASTRAKLTMNVIELDENGAAVTSTTNEGVTSVGIQGEVPKVDDEYVILNESATKTQVILRKAIEGTERALSGARFRIFRADLVEVTDASAGYATGEGNDPATPGYTSDGHGIYFVGELAKGTYYLVEVAVPSGADGSNLGKVFTLAVEEGGATGQVTTDRSIDLTTEGTVVAKLKALLET